MQGFTGQIAADVLLERLRHDPAIGVTVVDTEGHVHYANRAASQIYFADPNAPIEGRSIADIVAPERAAERLAIIRRVVETNAPAIFRHIRLGTQVQSTIYPLAKLPDSRDAVIAFTVEGEHDPAEPHDYHIAESAFAHLGHLDALTPRELEVLALIGQGLPTPEIAQRLHRSTRTVEKHAEAIRSKIGSASRVTLAAHARKAGLRVEDAAKTRY